jgi:hypothetical protein
MIRAGGCPICGAAAKPKADNPAFPFCTPRCRSIDLGAWLAEDYRIPTEPANSQEAEQLADALEQPPPKRT